MEGNQDQINQTNETNTTELTDSNINIENVNINNNTNNNENQQKNENENKPKEEKTSDTNETKTGEDNKEEKKVEEEEKKEEQKNEEANEENKKIKEEKKEEKKEEHNNVEVKEGINNKENNDKDKFEEAKNEDQNNLVQKNEEQKEEKKEDQLNQGDQKEDQTEKEEQKEQKKNEVNKEEQLNQEEQKEQQKIEQIDEKNNEEQKKEQKEEQNKIEQKEEKKEEQNNEEQKEEQKEEQNNEEQKEEQKEEQNKIDQKEEKKEENTEEQNNEEQKEKEKEEQNNENPNNDEQKEYPEKNEDNREEENNEEEGKNDEENKKPEIQNEDQTDNDEIKINSINDVEDKEDENKEEEKQKEENEEEEKQKEENEEEEKQKEENEEEEKQEEKKQEEEKEEEEKEEEEKKEEPHKRSAYEMEGAKPPLSMYTRRVMNVSKINDYLQSDSTRGRVGSRNLGNTCFMNSSIACLSNCTELTYYFLKGDYLKDINEENSLGMRGKLAKEWGNLMKQYWVEDTRVGDPSDFKYIIGQKCERFRGYGQQDSNEFMSVFLDYLNEDLNATTKKEYVELKEKGEDETDEQSARRFWEINLKRNNSIVTDLFCGQFKSTITCPDCGWINITFDPFDTINLPLLTQIKKHSGWGSENVEKFNFFYIPKNVTREPICLTIKDISNEEYISSVIDRIKKEKSFFYHDKIDDLLMLDILRKEKYGYAEKTQIVRQFVYDDEFIYSFDFNRENDKIILPVYFYSQNLEKENKSRYPRMVICHKDHTLNDIKKKIYFYLRKYILSPFLKDNEEKDELSSEIEKYMLDEKNELPDDKIYEKIEEEYNKVFKKYNTDEKEEKSDEDKNKDSDEEKNKDSDEEKNKDSDEDKNKDSDEEKNKNSDEDKNKNSDEDKNKDSDEDKNKEEEEEKEKKDEEEEKKGDEEQKEKNEGEEKDENDKDNKKEEEKNKEEDEHTEKIDEDKENKDKEQKKIDENNSNEEKVNPEEKKENEQIKNNEDNNAKEEGEKEKEKEPTNNEKNQENNIEEKTLSEDDILKKLIEQFKADIPFEIFIRRERDDNLYYGKTPFIDSKHFSRYSKKLKEFLKIENFDCPLSDIQTDISDYEVIVQFNPDSKYINKSAFNLDHYYSIEFDYKIKQEEEEEKKKENEEEEDDGKMTLAKCLKKFCKEEQLAEGDEWYCSKCKKHVLAKKKMDLYYVPKILIICFKRFVKESSYRWEKNEDEVEFPINNLDLKDFVIGPDKDHSKYDLFAVSQHYGGTGGGHYTAVCKNDGKWFSYNDSCCSETTESDCQSSAAYVLFYRRQTD